MRPVETSSREPLAHLPRMSGPPHLPLGRENGPHHMVANDRAVAERATEHTVSLRPQPLETVVAPAVDIHRAGLEAIDAELGEHRIEHQACARAEQPAAPERSTERE